MKWFAILIGLLTLTACETTETRIHNPNKPISAYDSDLYSCKMMAMQTNPAPAPAPSNETNTRCYAVGNTLNCSQRPIDNQPIGAPLYEMQRKRMINSMTEECMARQGWTKEVVSSQSRDSYQDQRNLESKPHNGYSDEAHRASGGKRSKSPNFSAKIDEISIDLTVKETISKNAVYLCGKNPDNLWALTHSKTLDKANASFQYFETQCGSWFYMFQCDFSKRIDASRAPPERTMPNGSMTRACW